MSREIVVVGIDRRVLFGCLVGIGAVLIARQWKEEIMYSLSLIASISEGKDSPDAWMGLIALSVACLCLVIMAKIFSSGGGNNDPPGGGLPPQYMVPRR